MNNSSAETGLLSLIKAVLCLEHKVFPHNILTQKEGLAEKGGQRVGHQSVSLPKASAFQTDQAEKTAIISRDSEGYNAHVSSF